MEKGKSLDEMLVPIEGFAMQASGRLLEQQNHRSQDVVEKVKQYVEANYNNPEISLTTAADYISVSSGYLSSMFKKATGTNFVKYLTDARMEKAEQLLRRTDMKTYEVAYETGFADPHYFSIAFKKHTGMSPSDFRNTEQ
jgi:two-component system response regulator YesN